MFRLIIRFLAYACVFASALCVHAQTARFSGQVTDPQNAAIPNAEVHVFNLDAASKADARTDGSGFYVVPYLPAGHYRVEVQAPGFSAVVTNNLALSVGQTHILNIQLGVESANSTVQVSSNSEVAQVNTENAEVSGTVVDKEVRGLQLNGRNFTQLLANTAGVSNQTSQDEAKVGVLGSVSYSINGGRTEYNSFQVDGSETLNTGINKNASTLVVYPSIDAIQEIKVLTSNYGAEYPSTGSGTTIVTTRSGTDQLHGSLYEFFRNEALNAKGYFDVGNSAPLYRRHDFGGTIGGPIVIPHIYNGRSKSYFFFSEEARLEKTPQAFRKPVPSLAERNGDFSDVCPAGTLGGASFYATASDAPPGSAIFPAANATVFPDCPHTGLSGGVVSGYPQVMAFTFNQLNYYEQLNRNAVALLNTGIIPAPNSTLPCNSLINSCYNADISLPTYYREELFRLDHEISSTTHGSFRYVHDAWDTTVPMPYYGFVQNSFPTIQNYFTGPGISLVARLTKTFSTTLLSDFTASYTDSHITLANRPGPYATLARPAILDAPCDPGSTAQCPMGSIFDNGFGGKSPGIVIAGNNQEYGGNGFAVDPGYMPWDHTNPVYSFSENLNKALGKHNFQFGGEWLIFQRNQTNGPIGAATGDVQGLLAFSNTQFAGPTGNAFANFLYSSSNGDGVSAFQQDSGQARYRQRYQIAEPYFQDDYKVSSRLTLNAGLRVSLFGTYYEAGNQAYNWVPSAYSKSLAATLSVDPQYGWLDNPNGLPLLFNPNNPTQNIDPRIINGIVHCGTGGVPRSCMDGHLWNPAPRVGVAWDPRGDGRMAVRAGYGIFFEHGTADEANSGSLEGAAPIILSETQHNPPSWSEIGKSFLTQSGGAVTNVTNATFPLDVTAIPIKAHWSYVQQFSLGIEKALPWSTLATIGYVGSKGTHLTTELEANQLYPVTAYQNPFGLHEPLTPSDCPSNQTPDPTTQGGVTITPAQPAYINLLVACSSSNARVDPNALRQSYPGLGEIYSLQNVANSLYQSLQATLRKVQGPLTLNLAYTYSHSIDNSSDRSDTTFVNSFDLRSNRASSNFDQRHLLHITYIYDLPLLRFWQSFASAISRDPDPENPNAVNPSPSEFATSGLARGLLNGWQLSGITIVESGIPFTVVNGGNFADNAGVANGVGAGSYPDIIGSPHGHIPAGGTNPQSIGPLLLNPGAFGAPRGLTFGNAGRNSLNNPRRTNFDMAVLKQWPLSFHESSLQFRAEAFNVFNHTQFRIYDPALGNQGNNVASCFGGSDNSAGDPSCLTSASFLHPVDAHRPRTVQLALKLSF